MRKISASRHQAAVVFRCLDVTFSKWPPSLWFSQIQKGRHRYEFHKFKMAADAVNSKWPPPQTVLAPLLRVAS